jgi:hypothetical protein
LLANFNKQPKQVKTVKIINHGKFKSMKNGTINPIQQDWQKKPGMFFGCQFKFLWVIEG